MDEDGTWYGGRPQSRGLCVSWEPAPLPKKERNSSPIFGPCLLWPNGWMDQDGTWHGDGGGPWSRPHCARWGPSSPPLKGGKAPIFGPFYCGQTDGCIKKQLRTEVGLSPGDFVLDGDPALSSKRGGTPSFSTTSIVAKRLYVSRCHLVRR